MKCYQCGYESEQDFTYCPSCGFAAPTQAVSQTGTHPILSALKDPLFLVLCILMSVSCIFSLAAGSVPLINILITVFLWLTYAQARKDVADAKHLRCVSGAVYAEYVIVYVVAGLMAVMGLIFAVALGSIAGNPGFLEGLVSGFVDLDEEIMSVLPIISSLSGGIIAVAFLFVAAIMVVFNIFSLRYIHRFAQSVYQSVEKNSLELVHANATKGWLIALTVFSGIGVLGSLGNLTAMIANASTFCTTLFPVLLINKYFK